MLETLCGGVDWISLAHYWIVVSWLLKQHSLLDVCHNLILHALQDLRSYSNELSSSIKTKIFLHYLRFQTRP
jgi:hypothetical protein